jgi:hypothetical protein
MKDGFRSAYTAGSLFLGEHPEDLGKSSTGEVPASIWADEEVRSLPGVQTGAIFQCPFGAKTSKPTRLVANMDFQQPNWYDDKDDGWPSLLGDEGADDSFFYSGWQILDSKFRYIGPLPAICGHKHRPLQGKDADGNFLTAAAAAYPPSMCRWLARNLLGNLFRKRRSASL